MEQAYATPLRKKRGSAYAEGLGLTLLMAVSAKYLAGIPFLGLMGELVIAITLGVVWRAVIGVPADSMAGISLSGKKLLRYGIILLGIRLNLADIVQAGPMVLAIALFNTLFALLIVYLLARLMKVESKLGILTACGTAICGATAVIAISPQIKASDEDTAIGTLAIAMIGTMFTLLYTALYPVFGLSAFEYGVFSGSTLHEVAHVIAAAAPGGNEAVDMALIVKLTRVALLVPVAVLIGVWAGRLERRDGSGSVRASWRSIAVPWFILGFVALSGINSFGIIPAVIADQAVTVAFLMISMAMAGLGLTVDIAAFRRLGMKPFAAGLLGSALLSIVGFALVKLFGLV
ncbi:YeiH family protein [Paenibacillus tarimensis]